MSSILEKLREFAWDAFDNDPIQFQAEVAKRCPSAETKIGSYFVHEQSPSSVLRSIILPKEHGALGHIEDPAITSPAIGVLSSLRGYLGVVDLSDLDDHTRVCLVNRHANVDGRPELSPEINVADYQVVNGDLPIVNHTTLLFGPGRDGKTILWTLFPGDVGCPANIPDISQLSGKFVSVRALSDLGVSRVKLNFGEVFPLGERVNLTPELCDFISSYSIARAKGEYVEPKKFGFAYAK